MGKACNTLSLTHNETCDLAMQERTVCFECFWHLSQCGVDQEGFSEEMIVELTSRVMGVTLSGQVRDRDGQEN